MSECTITATTFAIQVSFPIYIIALMSFISWFLFVLFGGIGLFALPLDLLYDFCTRPKKLNEHELESMKKRIVDDGMQLKELGGETKAMEERGAMKRNSKKKLKLFLVFNKERRLYNKNLNQLRAGTLMLDQVKISFFNCLAIPNDNNSKRSQQLLGA